MTASGMLEATKMEIARRRIAGLMAGAAQTRDGLTDAERDAYAEAVYNAPAAIYKGARMYPVDHHAIGMAAVEGLR